MKAAPILAALLVLGCAAVPPAGTAVTGAWGGRHVGLTLDSSGGRLEYDCAAGTIGPVLTGRDGRFTAQGTHTPGTGGPERVGEVRPAHPARYSGTVRGDRMMLHGQVDNGATLGPFELRRGAEPLLLRCL